jgi:sulfite reductase alpha subunit
MANTNTPLLDELEKGKWPSFVKDLKQAAEKNSMARDLLQQLELSYNEINEQPAARLGRNKT